MATYRIITPRGYVGAKFEADSDEAAITIANVTHGEVVQDIVDWQDGEIGLVVND